MMFRTFAFLTLLMTAGCAPPPVPMASIESDGAGKLFQPPAQGRAAVYIFATDGGGAEFSLTLGQRILGTLQSGAWLRADVPAGANEVRCTVSGLSGFGALDVQLSPGTTTFVSTRLTPTGASYCRLNVERADVGVAGVKQGRRIREIPGASD